MQKQVCLLHKGGDIFTGQAAMERYIAIETEVVGKALYLAVQRVHADDVQVRRRFLDYDLKKCPQERRLVFHRVQAADMQQTVGA